MEFKRHHHHQHQGFNFPRPGNSGNAPGGGYQPGGGFMNHHNSRPFKLNDGHNNNHNGARLNLTHSFRNLLKMQGDVISDRINGFQKSSQLRDLMLSRISTIASNLVKDEFLDSLIKQVREYVTEEGKNSNANLGTDVDNVEAIDKQNIQSTDCAGAKEDIKAKLRGLVHEALDGILEETRVYAIREDSIMGVLCAKERRVEKDFIEFFNEAERQIIEYEKKIRNDQYGQMINRLRSAEREMAMRDQKIIQLEDAFKVVSDRSERAMAELQQVNADHQFEKLQLYHHVEVCKFNAKCMAMEELIRICKWKRCACGQDYDDVFRELEKSFNLAYSNNSQDCGVMGRMKDSTDRREISASGSSSWIFPTGQSQVAPSQSIPTGSFIPSEEAATKGSVLNDLRDRYDELQLKAAVVPNYEEVRTMIMKIVCHFKTAGLRVCEEIKGKQFVSSLFYCNTEDLVPSKNDKTFSTGFGNTPEEATLKSVQRAVNEIQRLETCDMLGTNEGVEMTYVRRNARNVFGDNEAIRMTLIRSYCNEKVDEQDTSPGVHCFQEGNLYQNKANAKDKYMADWKIHIRVEDSLESGIKEKLQRVLRNIQNVHVDGFITDHRTLKEKAR